MALFIEDVCYKDGIQPFRIINIQIDNIVNEVTISCCCDKCSHPKTVYTTKEWWQDFVTRKGDLKTIDLSDQQTVKPQRGA